MSQILYGKPVAQAIKTRLLEQHQQLQTQLKMGIILVGDNPESLSYITRKRKMADTLGIEVVFKQLPHTAMTQQVCDQVNTFNDDPSVTGFIVQLPMPDHIDQAKVLGLVCPYKDIDGLNPWSLGKLLEGKPMLVSATARGVLALLDYYHVPVDGARAIVVGRSILVGKPTALLLLNQGATVTVAHSHTHDVAKITKTADIVVVAAGKPGLINAQSVGSDSIVVDVGMTSTPDGLLGDADFAGLKDRVKAISPVPGGVGPLTVICLFENLFLAYQLQQQSGHVHQSTETN